MSIRTFIYNTLVADAGIVAVPITQDRIIAGQSLMTAQTEKPYIVIRMGNDTDEQLFDDWDLDKRPHRQFFQIYVHDARPSYVQIDTICDLVKQALRLNQLSTSDGIIGVKFLERSADFDDVTLDTVFRYLRFQAIAV